MRSANDSIAVSGGIGGDIIATVHTDYAYGIRADQDVTVTNGISGNITATATTGHDAYGIQSEGATTLSGNVSGTISATAGTDLAYGIKTDTDMVFDNGLSGRISASAGGHTAIGLAVAVSAGNGMNLEVSGTLRGIDLSGGNAGYALRGGTADGAGGWTEADAVDTVSLESGANILGRIDLSQGNDTLVFDGQVTTDSMLSGGEGRDTLGLSGSGTWRLSNDLDLGAIGPASVYGGRLAVNGTLTSPSITVNTGGTLGGEGTLIGEVINGGTVAPGNSPGTMTIIGDYRSNPGSSLKIEVDDGGNHDRLVVSGTATLAEGSGIEVDVTTPAAQDYLLSQSKLSQVIQARAIAADPDALRVTDNSALLNFSPVISGGVHPWTLR